MGSDDVSARLDRLESISALTRIVHEFCRSADQRDLERFMALWHPDAVWVTHERAEGHDAIRAAILAQWDSLPELHHWATNVVVDADGDRGQVESDVLLLVRLRDGSRIRAARTYRDVVERRDGLWRILERHAGPATSFDGDVTAFGA